MLAQDSTSFMLVHENPKVIGLFHATRIGGQDVNLGGDPRKHR